MRCLRSAAAVAVPVVLILLACGFGTDAKHFPEPGVVVTAAPEYKALNGLRGEERFAKGAQLLLVTNGNAAPLLEGFAASTDASVSFDGKKVLFAGKRSAADAWAVWELTLADRAVRKVSSGDADAVRPLYLPGDRLVFARRGAHGFEIVAAQLDGTDELALTHIEASALPVDVLADGRILFEAGFPLGMSTADGAKPELFLVYQDGSGVESYRCDHPAGNAAGRWGGKQLASGDVVFTHGNSLARFTSPLAGEARVTAPAAEYAGGIAETADGDWLVSARANASAHYALREWKPGAAAMPTVFAKSGQDVVEPVILAAHDRPKKHPSGLHDWDYANLLALDARQSRDGAIKATPATVRLEAMSANGSAKVLGTAPVETDGSFFVKVPGDTPIRFALLDGSGAVIRQEHGWFWIRKGEQRICVGCHTGPEHAAENRVPAVLLRTIVPADLTGVEKSAKSGGR